MINLDDPQFVVNVREIRNLENEFFLRENTCFCENFYFDLNITKYYVVGFKSVKGDI